MEHAELNNILSELQLESDEEEGPTSHWQLELKVEKEAHESTKGWYNVLKVQHALQQKTHEEEHEELIAETT